MHLQNMVRSRARDGAFVMAGIGSLVQAKLRFANDAHATTIDGLLEILTLAGTASADGSHLHISVADAQGRGLGRHLVAGGIVRTTAEVLVVPVSGWRFAREFDAQTGYDELVVRRVDE